MYPHRMRLRGPWECEPLARRVVREGQIDYEKDNLPPRLQMTLPCRWKAGGLANFAGRVRFVRSFGYPSRVEAHERLWLTFEGANDTANVWLNGQFLGAPQPANAPFEFDVSAFLKARNELVVEVESTSAEGGLWGEVALEVRRSAYLRNVVITPTASRASVELRATGLVAGDSDVPLELFLLLEGKSLVYRQVQPSPAGEPFELVAQGLTVQLVQDAVRTARLYKARVDLVHGTEIWYGVEKTVTFKGPRDEV